MGTFGEKIGNFRKKLKSRFKKIKEMEKKIDKEFIGREESKDGEMSEQSEK